MIKFRTVQEEDRDFLIPANAEINELSDLNDSILEKNIDRDIFENKNICKVLIATEGNK